MSQAAKELLRAAQTVQRRELEVRGYSVATDTAGFSGGLYVRGEADRAAALFEFKSSAEEACLTMYQGSWSARLPSRLAVPPAGESRSPDVDVLPQAGS